MGSKEQRCEPKRLVVTMRQSTRTYEAQLLLTSLTKTDFSESQAGFSKTACTVGITFIILPRIH